MPMSWAGTPLRKNDMRRVLAGALTAMFGTAASASAPVAQTAPVISGLAASGATLTATPGTYAGAQTVTGQWQRNGLPISGATSPTYAVQASDGVNIAYLETATASGGATTTQRALSQYMGQVVVGARIPDTFASNKQAMCSCPLLAKDTLTQIKFVFPGYLAKTGATSPTGSGTEQGGGTVTLSASVEYPQGSGQFTQIKFAGSVTGDLGSRYLTSDLLTLPTAIPAGQPFNVRTFQTGTSNVGTWLNSRADAPHGAVCNSANSGLTDQTMGGTITNSLATSCYYPIAVLGATSKVSILIVGDSRVEGVKDTFDGSAYDIGCLGRAIGPQYAYINCGVTGDRGSWFNASHTSRSALAQYCSHVVFEYGINDIDDATFTLAQMQSMYATLWATYAGAPVYQATMEPNPTFSAAIQAVRNSANDYIRTAPSPLVSFIEVGALAETALSSDVWKTGYSDDNLHANQTGAKAVGAAISLPAFAR